MGTTSNGIWYPDNSDYVAPLEANFATMASSLNNVFQGVLDKQQKGIQVDGTLAATASNTTSDVNVGTYTVAAGWATGSRLMQVTVLALAQSTVASTSIRMGVQITGRSDVVQFATPAAGGNGRTPVGFTFNATADSTSAFVVTVLIRRLTGTGDVNLTASFVQIVDLGGV